MKAKKVKTTMKDLSPLLLAVLDENIDITLTVTGNSMLPLFTHQRDAVILTKCDPFNLKKGDIPLYRRNNGKYVLHRIVNVHDDSYDLCGDHQYIIEKNLPKENVIALVKAFTRKGKHYSCNCFIYKGYWHLRIFSAPFRRLIHKILRRIRRMRNEET